MLLTIRASVPGNDLGYLLHKNPSRVHSFELPFGQAHVFYPRVSEEVGEAALLLEVDPVGLVRNRSKGGERSLDQYVNDRPYAASSFLSVALSRVFGTAMSGRSKERPELAGEILDLAATVSSLPCRAGEELLRRLFEPLDYQVEIEHHPLDEKLPEWGEGPYYTVRLSGRKRLKDLLAHLYVLVPVMDADKHYWVGEDEIEKLLSKGEGWLGEHPEREAITKRYLQYDRRLTREALARLVEDQDVDVEATAATHSDEELAIEEPIRLWEQRIGAVMSALRAVGARNIIDLGCGEGRLLRELLKERSFERVVGMDVSWRSLENAGRRMRLEEMPTRQRERIELLHGSLMYRDDRLKGFDAATVVEVVEHLDPPRLAAFERVLFEHAQPRAVALTTPNFEYNVRFPDLPEGQFRHRDHRFEWTRREFEEWAAGVAERFGYSARFVPVGPEETSVGAPTQMGVFTR